MSRSECCISAKVVDRLKEGECVFYFVFKHEIKHSDVHISDCKENNEPFASIKEKVGFSAATASFLFGHDCDNLICCE